MYYIKVGNCPQTNCGNVQGVGDEVDHVPHIAYVLLEANVPELFYLAPDKAHHPS